MPWFPVQSASWTLLPNAGFARRGVARVGSIVPWDLAPARQPAATPNAARWAAAAAGPNTAPTAEHTSA